MYHYTHLIMIDWFQSNFKNFVELEVRRGTKGGAYSTARMKLGSMPKKDLQRVMVLLNQISNTTHDAQDVQS